MSKYKWQTDLYEIVVDADGEFVELYEQWLPHHTIIAEKICASWNGMHMEQYFDNVLKDNIQSAVMRCIQEKGDRLQRSGNHHHRRPRIPFQQ